MVNRDEFAFSGEETVSSVSVGLGVSMIFVISDEMVWVGVGVALVGEIARVRVGVYCLVCWSSTWKVSVAAAFNVAN